MSTAGDESLSDDLALAQRAALAGASLGLDYFARVTGLTQELKADGSIVTEADRAVETLVRAILLEGRPTDACLGEETGESGSGRRRWVLDGIDGTAVFVTGDNRWQTLIALEVEGQTIVGLAVVPAQGQLWWATRGAGAFVADFVGTTLSATRRLAVSAPPPVLPTSRLGIIPSPEALPADHRAAITPLMEQVAPQEWSVHPALLVASGDLDLAVQMGGQLWDYAALALIVEEAGGLFSRTPAQALSGVEATVFATGEGLRAAALAHLAV